MMGFVLIGCVLLGVGYFVLLSKYGDLWDEINPTIDNTKGFNVDVVIPFRNEEGNLLRLFGSLNALETKLHNVRVLLVNDHSSDPWENSLIPLNFEHKILHLPPNITGKKKALKLAWSQSKADIILQTDADCEFDKNWINSMLYPFIDDEVELVSGPVTFNTELGFFNKIVQLDFAALISIGAAHIQGKMPMICNGANLAYRKNSVEKANLNEKKASGDDVFLMQSIYLGNKNAVVFNKSKEALVNTHGPKSFKEFWNQRLRWASKNGDYSLKQNTLILAGVWFFNLCIVVALFSFTNLGSTIAAFLVVIKVLAEDKFYTRFASFFTLKNWFKTILIGQPFHILYMAIMPIVSQMVSYKWKERKLK